MHEHTVPLPKENPNFLSKKAKAKKSPFSLFHTHAQGRGEKRRKALRHICEIKKTRPEGKERGKVGKINFCAQAPL